MKSLLTVLLAGLTMAGFTQSSIYSLTVTGANAQAYPLSTFQGQKIMFVLLPTTQTGSDSAFILRIDSIAQADAGLATIAVPSYEDGYSADSANTLMNWYQASLSSNIIVSQPLYTHKTSGALQDPVFQWLTTVGQNTHFDDDVAGASASFFVDTQGGLYGVLNPGAAFSNKALSKVLP